MQCCPAGKILTAVQLKNTKMDGLTNRWTGTCVDKTIHRQRERKERPKVQRQKSMERYTPHCPIFTGSPKNGEKTNDGEGLQSNNIHISCSNLTNCSVMTLNLPIDLDQQSKRAKGIKRRSMKLSCVRRGCGQLDGCLHSCVSEHCSIT